MLYLYNISSHMTDSRLRLLERDIETINIDFTYQPSRKKRKINYLVFDIQSGFVKFQLRFEKQSWKCGFCNDNVMASGYCKHVITILQKYFELSLPVMTYFDSPEIITHFYDLVSQNNIADISSKLARTLKEKFSDYCGICSLELYLSLRGNKQYCMYQCPLCNNFVHSVCMTKWIKAKQAISCVHCRNEEK